MSKVKGFWEVGKWLQQTAITADEARERLDDSCSRCKFAATCNERKCPIYKEHELRLMALEGSKMNVRIVVEHTRKYTKPTLETRMRGALQRYLESRERICTRHEVVCLLNEVEVQIEMGSYSYALHLLVAGGLPKTAAKCQAIMLKYQMEVSL